ncbi:Pyruvate carboxylase subunit B [Neolecta irregularis DAH-3]|uniref:Pyruvate carboxylase subunit B n=1 Tax=Neolecta irregularis (strain DAH-3) TaxID=1198029 RepID=A0A1U7LNQ9_NEOID|nr:Pyruvate carboxylase subunit B [Neolecta irregularis DAH-3]|eukprot:OLL24287.1 Pyruvate carboxylase subunit B [Neolecta irregularis DAH-3]
MSSKKSTQPTGVIADIAEAHTSPHTAKFISMRVKQGTRVKTGDVVAVLEHLKTVVKITASVPGIVRFRAVEGQMVSIGEVVFDIEE